MDPADRIGAEAIVLLALFADIHANRQAFTACLDFARARGAQRFICLGDYVGYGADPEWAVETVMGLVEQGAIAVRGNHDNAIGASAESMNAEAQAAIEWTRGRLSAPERRFLSELPLTRRKTIASMCIPKPASPNDGVMSARPRMPGGAF